MVQAIPISEKTTLKYLREKFNLQRTDNPEFFSEWFDTLPEITRPLAKVVAEVLWGLNKSDRSPVFCDRLG
jgi:hypothetical protein